MKLEWKKDEVNEFKISCFNCKGFIFRNYQYIKKIFYESSILLIQEHWLFNFDLKMFKEVLPNCSFHASSSMRDEDLVRGRGHLCAVEIKCRCFSGPDCHVITQLCIVKYTTAVYNILIMPVYMPVNININYDTFSDILDEIKSLHLQYAEYD